MSKLYRVLKCSELAKLGINIGDVCTLHKSIDDDVAWFHNEKWLDNGVWCLCFTDVEEIVEEYNMEDLDYIYDKFENLILFLEAEVNNVEDCDEFTEAKKALKALYEVIETN